MARSWASGLLLVVLLAARPAAAEVGKYALVFGSNRGHVGEAELRYAERDIQSIGDTLAVRGGFPRNHIVRLIGASAEEIRAAILDLNLNIQRDVQLARERGEPGEAVLFVYYSGHGDARNLHLGSSDLSLDELSKQVRVSHAKLKVLVIDACRSGGLTRVKGGRVVAPFEIAANDRLLNEGYAIITSSTAGEDAQESEKLQSSIFTHYFQSALMGAGDTNKDLRVTLGEAYAYAYEWTLKASMQTVAGFQHPTFDFDLRGRADPVLTDLRSRGDQAELTLSTPGDYLVMLADTETIIAEANTKVPDIKILIPAASYLIRMRGRASMYQTEVQLKRGESRTVGPDTMHALALARYVRKGGTGLQLVQGPNVSGVVHGPLGSGYSPMVGAQIGYGIDMPLFSLMPRVALQGGFATDVATDALSNRVREIALELTALHAFDLGTLTVAPLLSAGLGLLNYSILRKDPCPAAGCVLTSNAKVAILSVGAMGSYALSRGFTLDAAVELMNFVGPYQESRRSELSWRFARTVGIPTYRTSLGLGYRF